MGNRHRDFSGAVFFIFIGLVFLLNTLGYVDWGIWLYMFKFWPLLLVLAGLKLIFGKTLLGEIIVAIFALIIYLSVGLISYSAYTGREYNVLPRQLNRCITEECGNFWGKQRNEQTITQAIPIVIDDVYESRGLEFNIAAASFKVVDSINDNHVAGTFIYDKELIEPSLEKKLVDGKLTVLFDTTQKSQFRLHPRNKTDYLFEIGTIENIPTDLAFEIGASQGEITLNQILINKFDVNIGAGKLDIGLSDKAIPRESISLDIGAGQIILTLPKEIGYSISYEIGIGNISVDGEDIATFAEVEKTGSLQIMIRL